MKNWLEKQFRLSEFNTDIKTELLAGLTTFVTMAYVLATIPNILAGAGYDKHTTLTVMILLIIVTSCAMALFTNRPFALAPGLGSVGIIASMITNEGVSMPIAAGVIFWSGVLFIIISFFGLREKESVLYAGKEGDTCEENSSIIMLDTVGRFCAFRLYKR